MFGACRCVIVLVLISSCVAPRNSTEDASMTSQSTQVGIELPNEGSMPSLEGATGWLNSAPLNSNELRGKVVLVDFWTFTCINWLRTQPYVRAWAEKYKSKGLVVIGVHTPEFEFEKDVESVRRSAKFLNVGYPIALDSNYAIWSAFGNRYWPAFYFIDAEGRIRHHQFGEGDYEKSERVIQKLLIDAGQKDVPTDLVKVAGTDFEKEADWKNLGSSENYTGYSRTTNFASPGGFVGGEPVTYSIPPSLALNEWALSGEWKVTAAASISLKPKGRVAYRFHARDLNVVMRPSPGTTAVRFRITVDGKPPNASHGVDTDEHGDGVLSEPRMYQLFRQDGPVGDRYFEIEFLDAGAEVYSFTFG
jgi:thiol-disulfide isomerase/thioredoxin